MADAPIGLTRWFRARMLPLVAATGVVVASAAPAAFYLRERWDLAVGAEAQAARVAAAFRANLAEPGAASDPARLHRRLAAAGLDRMPVVIVAGGGELLLADGPPVPRVPLWGRVEVATGDRVEATVSVAADHGALAFEALELAGASALLALGLAVVLYWVPVRAIGRAERRIAQLLGRLALTLQEEDRRRIARELHDGAGQAITAARLELAALRARLDPQALQRITRHLDEALDEVRRLTGALAPPALAELGLHRALERHCEAFADAAGLAVQCEVALDLPALGAEVETACYRIVQEALTNTARHAGATRAWVRLDARDGELRLEVGDDGVGLCPTDAAAPGGSGIEGIRERARLLGGEVQLGNDPAGGGVRIEVTLPLERRA